MAQMPKGSFFNNEFGLINNQFIIRPDQPRNTPYNYILFNLDNEDCNKET